MTDPVFLASAIEAALGAGRIQQQYFRQNTPVHKKGRIDLVTAADLAVEAMFRQLVGRRFPSHIVLGEEAAGQGASGPSSAFRWIIDPVDGTTNFAHGLQFFCVSIALEVAGQVELGVVYDPTGDELFTAERGGGARLNGRRLAVSPQQALVDCLLCTGFPYSVREDRREPDRGAERHLGLFGAFLEESQGVRRLGSAALDLCYVAAGRLDGYWEERIHPWDIAAGGLIVSEAGGRVSGLSGEPFDPFLGHVLASNGRVHDAMLTVMRRSQRNLSA